MSRAGEGRGVRQEAMGRNGANHLLRLRLQGAAGPSPYISHILLSLDSVFSHIHPAFHAT